MEKKVTLAAHRGWRAKYPENTMRGFREALKLDIGAIEMDVHMTKDYHIVICHDAKLDRTTNICGQICNMTLEEVRAADAGIKFGEEFKGEKIPTLEEFLELMATRPDIKVLLEVLRQLVDQGNTVIIIEHNLDVLKSVDYIFDMGPEGGKKGGVIVAQGTPEELAQNPDSVTGPFLKEIL